jgi:hypothetical protein
MAETQGHHGALGDPLAGGGTQYLTFILNGEHYGIDILKVQGVQGKLAVDRRYDVDELGAGGVIQFLFHVGQRNVTDERARAPDTKVGQARVAVEVIAEVQHTMKVCFTIKNAEHAEGSAENAQTHHTHRERFGGARGRDIREGVGDDAGEVGGEAPVDDQALVFLGGKRVGNRLVKARHGQRVERAGSREAFQQAVLDGAQRTH